MNVPDFSAPDFKASLARVMTIHARWLGLTPQPEALVGAHLVLPDGRRIPRRTRYLEVPAELDEVFDAAHELLRGIRAEHGPGRCWFLLEPVHVVNDDGMIVHLNDLNEPVVRVRTIYGHEAAVGPITSVFAAVTKPADEHNFKIGMTLAGRAEVDTPWPTTAAEWQDIAKMVGAPPPDSIWTVEETKGAGYVCSDYRCPNRAPVATPEVCYTCGRRMTETR